MPEHPQLVNVDPTTLRTTSNVRTDLHLTPEFLDSIATLGVQVPIVAVRGPDGGLDIEHGHRRAAAAAHAGLTQVPVMIVPTATTDATRLLTQIAENHARVALSTADLVAAHEQLALLGVTLGDAARATGATRHDVTAARALAASRTIRTQYLDTLDLEQAATLAEFDDDPELLEDLAAVANSGARDDFRRAVQRARDDRAAAAALHAEGQRWSEQGYTVIVRTGWAPPEPGWWPLWKLRTPGGQPIDDDSHAGCPGRAVAISPAWRSDTPPKVTQHCIDPEKHGHALPPEPQHSNDADSKATKAADRAVVVENNKAWRAAEPVRRDHIRTWLATAKPTPAITRWILAELLTTGVTSDHRNTVQLRDLGWANDVLRPAGPPPADATPWALPPNLDVHPGATSPRATIGILAVLLAGRELATDVHSWRTPNPDSTTARYLTFLADHTGYTLGPVETLAAGLPDPRRSPESSQAAASGVEPSAAACDPDAAVPNSIGDPLAEAPLAEPRDEAHSLAGNSAIAGR